MKEQLNSQQLESIKSINGPLLIIAGAGSGKTTVITCRIAEMISQGISPDVILALTFTNKAANEMRERVSRITDRELSNLKIATFHAFGAGIIQEKFYKLGYRPKMSIYDNADKLSCIRKSALELKFPHEPGDIKYFSSLFSDIKCQRTDWDKDTSRYRPLYIEYQDMLKLHNSVDFDDLIAIPLQMLKSDSEQLADYQNRYQYIMVDEFQDTSAIQYQLVKHIANNHRNLCCVGDDDQSIYSWRGADYSNIINFENDFPGFREIKLERNYRSSSTILQAANAIIKNNSQRKDKELWTEKQSGETIIQLMQPDNEREEANLVAETIAILRIEDSMSYGEMGILVRTNGLCQNLEDALLANNIPYTVSGGTSFFQRQEIRDIIAYLRVIDDPHNDVFMLRILNTPRRGLGKSSIQLIISTSRIHQCSIYSALMHLLQYPQYLPGKAAQSGLVDLLDIIDRFHKLTSPREEKSGLSLTEICSDLVESINYWGYLFQEFGHSEKIAKWRYNNIKIFLDMIERWESEPENTAPTLNSWLNRITLNSLDDVSDDTGGKVSLMTIHCAKGLEFSLVFVCGVEEGLLPHARSLEENPQALEEERRLFYVAITRARSRLYISYCNNRKIGLKHVECQPSPFLNEIPGKLLEHAELNSKPPDTEQIVDYLGRKMPWQKEKE